MVNERKSISTKPPQRRLETISQEIDSSDSNPTGGALCTRCASVDLDAALSSEQEAILVEELGPITAWSTNSCILCKLLASRIPGWWTRVSPAGYRLATTNSHSVRVKNNIPLLQALPPTNLLELYYDYHRTRFYFVPQNEGFEPIRSLKTSSIDFSVLKDWLDLCQTMHTQVCNDHGREPKTVEHFKLIDCHTRQIVTAQNVDYVTLSYVWGPTEKCHEFSEQLPPTLPTTIEDAITVTQNLGLRYIWIDRYCINQKQKGHAYLQMSQMDLIYQNSIITIVAAAGGDPSYGLPGVSRRERRPQPRARIRSTILISPLPKTHILIANSHWASRGWTYQEAVLSRRRLVFTDEQVYFQCNGMHCYETFQIPWKSLHTSDRQSLEAKYQIPPFHWSDGGVIFPFGVGTTRNAVIKRILEYSRKSLTRQYDRLNAFLGILRVFETQGTYHCWGTPILSRPFIPGMEPSKDDLGLGFLEGLCWTLEDSSNTRIPHLPSWSWTGWSGGVWYYEFNGPYTSVLQAFVELSDGSVLDWNEFQRRYTEINHPVQLSHFLHVGAPTFKLESLSKHYPYHKCEIKMKDGWFLRWTACITQYDVPLSQRTKAVIVMSAGEEGKFVILLNQLEEGFERIWGGWIRCSDISLLRPDHKEADLSDLRGRYITQWYGPDWENSIVSTWETLRIG